MEAYVNGSRGEEVDSILVHTHEGSGAIQVQGTRGV